MALLSGNALGQVILSDSTFLSADWVPLLQQPDVTFSSVASGGDPGSFGEIILSDAAPAAPPGSENAVGNVFLSPELTYDPSTQGAIQSLSFSIDTESIAGTSQVSLVLEQDGDLEFVSNGPGTVTSASWEGYSEELSTNSNTGIPNFTTTGDPIEFGLYVLASSPGNIESTAGVDNLVINVNATPEPSTWLLVLGSVSLLVPFCRARLSVTPQA